MLLTDPVELKIIEKYREIMKKQPKADSVGIMRAFSFPSQLDSDEMMHISVAVSVDSRIPSTTEMELKTSRAEVEAIKKVVDV